MEISYNLYIKQKETLKIQLPSLKFQNKFLSSFNFESDYKSFEIKIIGKDNIATYGEASLSISNVFSLKHCITSILNSDLIFVSITNTSIGKDTLNKLLNFKLIFSYDDVEYRKLYENTYSCANAETFATILNDIKPYSQKTQKIIFTNCSILKLTPQFLCRDTKSNTETSIIDVLEFQDTADTGIIEFNTPDFFSDDINYYNLTLELKQNNENDVNKFGMIVYGF